MNSPCVLVTGCKEVETLFSFLAILSFPIIVDFDPCFVVKYMTKQKI